MIPAYLRISSWPLATGPPPTGRLSKSAIVAMTSLSAYTASITKDRLIANSDPERGPLLCIPAVKENITKPEAKAVTQLKNNKQIIIKPADKGGAVCVKSGHVRTGRAT